MFVQKILANELIDILAAPSYSPEILSYVNKISDAVVLKDFLIKKPKLGVTGTIAKDYVSRETPDAIPYISTKQVSGLYAYIEDAKFISKSADIEWEKCRVYDGNIVINKSGNVGAAAIVKASPYKYVNSVSDIISIEINESLIDKEYLVVYLNSPYGQKQLQRLSGGAIFDHVSLHAIPNIKIFSASILAQKYIGDKVRQAELLREWAKNIQNRATNILPVFKNRIADYKENYFKSNEIFSERLDSQFYHPNNIALEHELKLNNCVKLSHFAKLIKQNWDKDKAQEFLYFEIGGLDISTGLIQPELINVNDAPSRAKTKVRYADVLVSTVRPNRKNVGFIAIDDSTLEMVATSGFSVLRFEKAEIAAFYHFWLKSDDATSQLMRWNSGSAYPAIDDDVPLNILVPKFEQHLIDEWGTKLLFAQLSYIYAQKLVGYAKFIVEALIEDVITEEELIQAQNALEQGDKSLDRAILSQMTEDGYAVAGSKPLFADLDEFYDLLEQAKALE